MSSPLSDMSNLELLARALFGFGIAGFFVVVRKLLPSYLESKKESRYGQFLVAIPLQGKLVRGYSYFTRIVSILVGAVVAGCILVAAVFASTNTQFALVLLLLGGYLAAYVGLGVAVDMRIFRIELRERGIVTRLGIYYSWEKIRWQIDAKDLLVLFTPAGPIRIAIGDRERAQVIAVLSNHCHAQSAS